MRTTELKWPAVVLLVFAGFVISPGMASAQDMEPRAYANAPVGMNFMGVTYQRSSGNVVVDESFNLEDVEARFNIWAIGYVRTADFFGRSAKVSVIVPYSTGDAAGLFDGQPISGTRSGLVDPIVKVSVNFIGGPALRMSEFVRYQQKTLVGASLRVTAPLGQYDPNKIVNLGTNRWSFRPELALSRLQGKWTFEVYGSVTFYTANHRFRGTSTLSQAPIGAVQGHVNYTFRPGLWLSFNTTFYAGGQTDVDGVKRNDLKSNTRCGVTFSLPIARQQSLKFLISRGLVTRIGSDFRTLGVGYQFAWGGKK